MAKAMNCPHHTPIQNHRRTPLIKGAFRVFPDFVAETAEYNSREP